ncbi:ROK family transcriptional regulator [Diplocloster hominis]|uniref:ROK family transcriptional regulator n=1 Tax=Diplocloster hominis TaxID=3079010 RepID=UPI0031B9CAF0
MSEAVDISNIRNTAAMPSDLKYKNRVRVLQMFRYGEELSVNDVATNTGISRQTVTKAVLSFMEKGLLRSAGKGTSTDIGGKRPELFYFQYKKYLLCIGMEASGINISLMDLKIRTILAKNYPCHLNLSLEEFKEILKRGTRELLEGKGIQRDDIYGISLSTPGIVDYNTGILKFCSTCTDWGRDIPMSQILYEMFPGKAIIIENVAKMAGRAVLLGHEEYEEMRLVVIYSDEGISACYIDKGHILNGRNSLIGEIGHMTVDLTDEELCGCGSRGCLERLVSPARIRKMIQDQPDKRRQSKIMQLSEETDIPQLSGLADQGDAFAREIVSYTAKIVSCGLRNISLNFDPQIVIFQGRLAYAGEWFNRELKRYLNEFQYYPQATDAFELLYDRRPPADLQAWGSSLALANLFFKNPELYAD